MSKDKFFMHDSERLSNPDEAPYWKQVIINLSGKTRYYQVKLFPIHYALHLDEQLGNNKELSDFYWKLYVASLRQDIVEIDDAELELSKELTNRQLLQRM